MPLSKTGVHHKCTPVHHECTPVGAFVVINGKRPRIRVNVHTYIAHTYVMVLMYNTYILQPANKYIYVSLYDYYTAKGSEAKHMMQERIYAES